MIYRTIYYNEKTHIFFFSVSPFGRSLNLSSRSGKRKVIDKFILNNTRVYKYTYLLCDLRINYVSRSWGNYQVRLYTRNSIVYRREEGGEQYGAVCYNAFLSPSYIDVMIRISL